MEQYTPIAYLKQDAKYNGVFLIREVRTRYTKARERFLSVVLCDMSGEITGYIWGVGGQNLSFIQPGKYIQAEIKTQVFRDELTFMAEYRFVQPFKGIPKNIHDYMPTPGEGVIDFYSNEFRTFIDSLDDVQYRDLFVLPNIDILGELSKAPYGKTPKLKYPGGLLVHTVHTLRAATGLASGLADVEGVTFNRSLLIAAGTFRNIGWATTSVLDGQFFRPRDAYFMTGIEAASMRFVDQLMLQSERMFESKKQALYNACGPESDIKTLEGRLVTQASNISEFMHLAGSELMKPREGNWRGGMFVGHLT